MYDIEVSVQTRNDSFDFTIYGEDLYKTKTQILKRVGDECLGRNIEGSVYIEYTISQSNEYVDSDVGAVIVRNGKVTVEF